MSSPCPLWCELLGCPCGDFSGDDIGDPNGDDTDVICGDDVEFPLCVLVGWLSGCLLALVLDSDVGGGGGRGFEG